MKNFDKAKKLLEARRILDLTQVEMGRLLSLTSTYISELENGKREIGSWYMEKLKEILSEPEASIRKAKEDVPGGGGGMAELEIWRRRAKLAEKNLADLRDGLRSLLALSSNLPPEARAGKVSDLRRPPEGPALNETPERGKSNH